MDCPDCKKAVSPTKEHINCKTGKVCVDCKSPIYGYGPYRSVLHSQKCDIWLTKLLKRQGIEL